MIAYLSKIARIVSAGPVDLQWEGMEEDRTFGPIPAPLQGGGGDGGRDCNVLL